MSKSVPSMLAYFETVAEQIMSETEGLPTNLKKFHIVEYLNRIYHEGAQRAFNEVKTIFANPGLETSNREASCE